MKEIYGHAGNACTLIEGFSTKAAISKSLNWIWRDLQEGGTNLTASSTDWRKFNCKLSRKES